MALAGRDARPVASRVGGRGRWISRGAQARRRSKAFARSPAGRRWPRSRSNTWPRSIAWACGTCRRRGWWPSARASAARTTRIVLVGTADLNRSQRMMLDQVADRVTALVFAPEKLADRFDEHGCICPAAWLTQEIPLADEQMRWPTIRSIRRRPWSARSPASTAATTPSRSPSACPTSRSCLISSSACGNASFPPGTASARRLPVRPPIRLLAAVADYVETAGFSALAALVRHPWVHDWLLAKGIRGRLAEPDGPLPGRAHAQHALDGQWQGDGQTPRVDRTGHKPSQGLCRELQGKPRPLAEWAQPILELARGVFGAPAAGSRHRARPHGPGRLRQDPRSAGGALADSRGADAVAGAAPRPCGLVLRQVDGETIPPPPDHGAIEMLGWLELPLDDAPALVVTGFNEGSVPASLNADLFLPNQLRRALEIEDNDRRYARDAYALSVLAASREKLPPDRRAAERRGRSLAAQPAAVRLRRCDHGPAGDGVLLRRSDRRPAARSAAASCEPGQRAVAGWRCPGRSRWPAPITSMRVTEFKDYLGCPYRYYLRHVLKLESLADSAEELDGAVFGSLAHEVLSALGKDPDVAAAKAEAIAKYLDSSSTRPCSRTSARRRCRRSSCRSSSFGGGSLPWPAGRPIGPAKAGGSNTSRSARPTARRCSSSTASRCSSAAASTASTCNEASGKRMIFDYKTSDRAKIAGEGPSQEERRVDRPATAPLPAPGRRPGDRRARWSWPTSTFPRTSAAWGTCRRSGRRRISHAADRAAAEVVRR